MNSELWKMWVSRVTQWLLLLLVVTIPFSIRYVFDAPWNFQTGAYSDFTSLSLYISDFIILALIVLAYWGDRAKKLPKVWKYLAMTTIVWLVIEMLVQNHAFLPLQVYFSARIFLLILLAVAVYHMQVSREKLAWTFVLAGTVQSLIAAWQFVYQKSLGLYFFGESHLGPDILGVAKIVSHGTKLIRGYGTFPHPNLLGAFLVIASILNLYLIAKTYQIPRGEISPRGKFIFSRGTLIRLILHISLFFNIFGVFISFSRAAMLGLFGSTLLFLIIRAYTQKKLDYRLISTLFLSITVSVAILWPFLGSRATISDSATKERLFYNQVGKEIILNKPIFGTGPGVSVLHMKQFSDVDLQSWEIQPIHNYYLISMAEMGLGGLIWLILALYSIFLLIKRKIELWSSTLLVLGVGLLFLFLFDHYFYTIWPTQVLLWLLVGLALNFMWNRPDPVTYDTVSSK